EMSEDAGIQRHLGHHRNIRQIENEPQRTYAWPNPSARPNCGEHQNDSEREIVQWEDPQRAPGVEISEVSCRVLCVVEDPGDEKPGQHKEKVDAYPAKFAGGKKSMAETKIARAATIVKIEHQQNRQTANAIQSRDMNAQRRRRLALHSGIDTRRWRQ